MFPFSEEKSHVEGSYNESHREEDSKDDFEGDAQCVRRGRCVPVIGAVLGHETGQLEPLKGQGGKGVLGHRRPRGVVSRDLMMQALFLDAVSVVYRTLLHALTMSQTIPDIQCYSQIFPVS